jgi:hexosaminidase
MTTAALSRVGVVAALAGLPVAAAAGRAEGRPAVSPRPVTAQAPNPRPSTIPALRHWSGARGSFRLRRSPRIVVPARHGDGLVSTARVFASDLRQLTGRPARIAVGDARPRRGDIALLEGGGDSRLGREGYELRIGAIAAVRAPTPTGVFHGTRTLLQLIRQGSIPRGRARDWPRYPERGLMIDLGRRRYPSSWIRAEIKELAYLKLNLLHLHLTDDQRWGIEGDTHPEIVSADALTKREVRAILALARRYHVTVVPEIDMPGHMGALLAKHPELELEPARGGSSAQTAAGAKLDITEPRALRIVRRLLDEYLGLFPGPYWDVGADEYLTPAEAARYPQLAAFATRRYGRRAGARDAILGFVNRVDRIVRRHGKTLRAWHDELGDGGVLKANADIVVDWWITSSPLSDPRPPTPQQLLARRHRILNAGWFPTYFTSDGGPLEPDMRKAYESWAVNRFCGPTLNDAFILGPCSVISPDAAHNLGSKVNAWGLATLTLPQIATGLFPRLRVLAQKTWSSAPSTPTYAGFQRVMAAVGGIPAPS